MWLASSTTGGDRLLILSHFSQHIFILQPEHLQYLQRLLDHAILEPIVLAVVDILGNAHTPLLQVEDVQYVVPVVVDLLLDKAKRVVVLVAVNAQRAFIHQVIDDGQRVEDSCEFLLRYGCVQMRKVFTLIGLHMQWMVEIQKVQCVQFGSFGLALRTCMVYQLQEGEKKGEKKGQIS